MISPFRKFFCQAEVGIRYHCVTGVQTCALPILLLAREYTKLNSLINANCDLRTKIYPIGEGNLEMVRTARSIGATSKFAGSGGAIVGTRSEERRVGKECRSRWSPYH